MDWKEFVKDGQTIRTHTPLKGWKMLQTKAFHEVHTEIYYPKAPVK